MDEWEKYEMHHRSRLAFKPGLTGMWQVSGRSNITDFEEVVRLDTKTIAAIYQTHLDQRISFLHEPSEGRFSLSLDLSEVFKPVIVFKTIFDLVNNRRLQVEKHFDKQVNYCVLNEEGRKIFIESFEERLESVFMHPKLKRKVSYRTALKLDCYKLIKNILEEKEFVPFSLKEGM